VIGDLIEEWSERRLSRGAVRADAWLWAHALALITRLCCFRRRRRERRATHTKRKGDGVFETLWSDVRYGTRTLARSPGFTLVATLTLALGIGANTAIFSVVNTLLIRPLPLRDSNRLVAISGRDKKGERQFVSYPDFQDMQGARSFSGMSAFVPQSVNLAGRDEPTRVRGGFVSDNFFKVIGVEPAQGRGFLQGKDDAEGAERVCILQWEAWQGLLSGDPRILGKAIVQQRAVHHRGRPACRVPLPLRRDRGVDTAPSLAPLPQPGGARPARQPLERCRGAHRAPRARRRPRPIRGRAAHVDGRPVAAIPGRRRAVRLRCPVA
jgi:hypothetical protein